jgi:Flp pilus assembly protein TadG
VNEHTRRRQPAQALVELALVLPLLLVLAFGTIGVGRLVRIHMAVDAVAREAAREATLAPIPLRAPDAEADHEASQLGERRGNEVASGYGLHGTLVTVDAANFDRGSWVQAEASFTLSERDLPLLGWARFTFHAVHRERVDLYRSSL